MSLVRISKNLLTDVEKQINRTSNTVREKTIDPLAPKVTQEVKDKLLAYAINEVWGPHGDLKDRMPKEWLHEKARAHFHINKDNVQVGLEIQVADPSFCLPCTSSYNNGQKTFNVDVSEAPPEYTAPLMAWDEARKAHDEKFKRVKAQVRAFLNASASLNDALKRYPDLALYIPEQYIERVNEKVERQARERTEKPDAPNIDRDFLTSTGVVGKLHE